MRIYEGHHGGDEDFSRTVSLALLGVTPQGAASFVPRSAASLESDWGVWCGEVFRETVGPIFCAAYEFGSQLKFREVASLDAKLSRQLPAVSRGLIEASRPFVEGKGEMRGHPEWVRYVRKVDAGEAPGHLPVIFALHSVLYRLPLASALLAYAWLEWKGGHRLLEKGALAGTADAPPPAFLEARKQIPLFMNGKGFPNRIPELRVL